ncbi:MAG TPA: glycosyltransferase [Steroidobacteraceae bacterium]|nr:glycosyltransferase [Steroidobacteraceae bacterium]
MGLRILMISDVYFPRINGVSTSIQTFRSAFAESGHEPLLIAPAYPVPTVAPAEADIVRVASRYVPRDPEDRMMRGGAFEAAAAQYRRGDFDIVHIQTPFVAHYRGIALARRLGVPVVETYHTYFEEYLHHYVPLLPRRLMRFLARRFTVSQCRSLDALVVPSRAMQAALAEYGVTTEMAVIPTGLDMRRFAGGDGARFRAALGISAERPVLVHVGRIAHEKNVDFLLRMLVRLRPRIPEVQMVIAGEGPALAHCRALADSLGLAENVRFVGYLDRGSTLLDCYRAGDLFVFASRTETQGLVLLESMALGTPVVATAHMGTCDILEPQRGSVIAPDDEQGFADTVGNLLLDGDRRRALATDAPAYAATWSAGAMAARLVELYQEVCERHRERAIHPSAGLAAGGPGGTDPADPALR